MTEIRDAAPNDLEPVATLDAALFDRNGWSLSTMSAEFAAAGETRTVLVATSGTLVVGYAILLTVGDVADVQRIGVAGSAQRQGLGGRLLESLLARAAAGGYARVLLEVEARNAAAIALYAKHGFTEIARRPDYYRKGSDAVVMAKDLG